MAGNMSIQEAFDKGIIDQDGCIVDIEQYNLYVDGNPIPTLENLDNELHHAEKDLELAMLRSRNKAKHPLSYLSPTAIENLSKPYPSCNVCNDQMRPRHGMYGKFYYCVCDGQPTVSDKYWQAIKSKYNKG
jgi:hypothetical protein